MREQATCGAGVQLSSGGGLSPEDDPNTIHIFSVASGHMYERLQKIMILSVTRNTRYNTTVAPGMVVNETRYGHLQHPGMVICSTQVWSCITPLMVTIVTSTRYGHP